MVLINTLLILDIFISLFIFIYNFNVNNVQKTPVQQNWLSVGVLFQIFICVSSLCYKDFYVDRLILNDIGYLSIAYILLYSTKFNRVLRKYVIKCNLCIINMFIPMFAFYALVDFLIVSGPNMSILTLNFYYAKHYLVNTFVLYVFFSNIFAIIKNYSFVRPINTVLRIFLMVSLFLISLDTEIRSLILYCSCILIFILINILLIIIIYFNKGRFYR